MCSHMSRVRGNIGEKTEVSISPPKWDSCPVSHLFVLVHVRDIRQETSQFSQAQESKDLNKGARRNAFFCCLLWALGPGTVTEINVMREMHLAGLGLNVNWYRTFG